MVGRQGHPPDEFAFFCIGRQDYRTAFSPFQQGFVGTQIQFPFGFPSPMAALALAFQNRLDDIRKYLGLLYTRQNPAFAPLLLFPKRSIGCQIILPMGKAPSKMPGDSQCHREQSQNRVIDFFGKPALIFVHPPRKSGKCHRKPTRSQMDVQQIPFIAPALGKQKPQQGRNQRTDRPQKQGEIHRFLECGLFQQNHIALQQHSYHQKPNGQMHPKRVKTADECDQILCHPLPA